MSSRTWGNGGIVWSPGQVSANIYVRQKTDKFRRISINWHTVSEQGNLKRMTLALDNIDEESTIEQFKAHLTLQIPGGIATERLRLSWWGSELPDSKKLHEIASASEIQLELQVRRRQLPAKSTASDPPTSMTSASDPASLGCTALLLRSIGSTQGRSAVLTGVNDEMDVMAVRALVAKLPLAREMWKEEQNKPAEGDGKKKADKPGKDKDKDKAKGESDAKEVSVPHSLSSAPLLLPASPSPHHPTPRSVWPRS